MAYGVERRRPVIDKLCGQLSLIWFLVAVLVCVFGDSFLDMWKLTHCKSCHSEIYDSISFGPSRDIFNYYLNWIYSHVV